MNKLIKINLYLSNTIDILFKKFLYTKIINN